MATFKNDPLSYQVIGCALEVYKTLGPGLLEKVYQKALIIIELKSVEELNPVHYKQLTSYLKLTGKKVGLLINFNVDDLMDGIHRIVNNY